LKFWGVGALSAFIAAAVTIATMQAWAQSRPPQQYKVVSASIHGGDRALEAIANEHAASGWRLHSVLLGGLAIFQRK